MVSIDSLLAANGQPDEMEPWCAADSCPTIEIRGEDLVALCSDGVARWSNRDREWYEVNPDNLGGIFDEVLESGAGGNVDEAERLLDWIDRFWAVVGDPNDA